MIVIIGAGWYGLHLAVELKKRGIPYIVYEKSDRLFSGASYKNQNRLHQGFHYPRSFETRMQSKTGFEKFVQEYGFLTNEINSNIYAIPYESNIDFKTCLQIFESSGLSFDIVNLAALPDIIFEGAFKVSERFICPILARRYFESLKLNIRYNSLVSMSDQKLLMEGKKIDYDILFDCSYGSMITNDSFFEEFFLTHIVKLDPSTEFDALTVIDGKFFSIYPFTDGRHTITHVKLGIIDKSFDLGASERLYNETVADMENFVPGIRRKLTLLGSYVSRKYKAHSKSDFRGTKIISNSNNIYSVIGGKIDTIFEIDEFIESIDLK